MATPIHYHTVKETITADGRCGQRKNRQAYATKEVAVEARRADPWACGIDFCFNPKHKVIADALR